MCLKSWSRVQSNFRLEQVPLLRRELSLFFLVGRREGLGFDPLQPGAN